MDCLDSSYITINGARATLERARCSCAVLYSKPFESFSSVNHERDLVAHAALYAAGYCFEVLPEDAPKGFSNIDIYMNGEKWEIKSPQGDNPRAVESNLRKAKSQFTRSHPAPIQTVNVIFNGVFYRLDDKEISALIQRVLNDHGIAKVIQVLKDGTLRHFKQA